MRTTGQGIGDAVHAMRPVGEHKSTSLRQRATRADHGAVTAEVAIVLPMLMATMLAGLWAVGLVVANIRCIDAARDIARAVARGEPAAEAERIGERAAPEGAVVAISQEQSIVRVVVKSEARLDWTLFDKLPAVPIVGRATIEAEPTQHPALSPTGSQVGQGIAGESP